MQTNPQIIQEVRDIYQWLDTQLAGLDRSCRACGQCCDFETFGHRLYVTTPELIYFVASLTKRGQTPFTLNGPIKRGQEPFILAMPGGVCPYRIEGKCSVYPYRFSGCRIFTCGGSDTEQENALCEQAIRKFKDLCHRHKLPYHYVYLKAGLEMLREGVFENLT